MRFQVIIPARRQATRLPDKPLLELAGRPLIAHVIARALASRAEAVFVATDDAAIAKAASTAGAEVVMTRADHPSGTDRLAEVVVQRKLPDDLVIVNVQGDEPLMPPTLIDAVAELLARAPEAAAASICTPIHTRAEWLDPNAVKVVMNTAGDALYFSRAPIPFWRDAPADLPDPHAAQATGAFRHLGLYAYRAGWLRQYPDLLRPPMEGLECLEQLRILAAGGRIRMHVAREAPPAGVDTPADLERVRAVLEAQLAGL